MELKITIDNQKFTAKLPETSSVWQLSEYLPISETFQRSGDHEFFCRLDRGINVRGMEETSDIHAGGIYYFDAWKAISFVYKDMSISPYQVVWLGDFEEDVRPVLAAAKNKIAVELEVSE